MRISVEFLPSHPYFFQIADWESSLVPQLNVCWVWASVLTSVKLVAHWSVSLLSRVRCACKATTTAAVVGLVLTSRWYVCDYSLCVFCSEPTCQRLEYREFYEDPATKCRTRVRVKHRRCQGSCGGTATGFCCLPRKIKTRRVSIRYQYIVVALATYCFQPRLKAGGVTWSFVLSFVLSVCLSVCEQDNSLTRLRTSTKYGRHGQGFDPLEVINFLVF